MASPNVLVKDGSASPVVATNGVNVTPGNVITIQLADPSNVSQWFLQIVSVDEVTGTSPILSGVDSNFQTMSSSSTPFFTAPSSTGRAVLLKSTVNTGGPANTQYFAVYTLTSGGLRVGALGERLESDSTFGWSGKVNALIRAYGNSTVNPANSSSPNVSATTPVVGTSTSYARQDHTHQVTSGTPVALTVGGSNTTGSATSLALSDHKHALPAVGTPVALTVGGSNTSGVATTIAASDHTHALPAFGTTGGTFAQGNDARFSTERAPFDTAFTKIFQQAWFTGTETSRTQPSGLLWVNDPFTDTTTARFTSTTESSLSSFNITTGAFKYGTGIDLSSQDYLSISSTPTGASVFVTEGVAIKLPQVFISATFNNPGASGSYYAQVVGIIKDASNYIVANYNRVAVLSLYCFTHSSKLILPGIG